MRSFRTPICCMKTSLRLTPLTLSSWVLGYGTRAHPLGQNLMSTHSLGHQSSSFGFVTSFSGKPKIHGWICICNNKPFRLNHNHLRRPISKLREEELLSLSLHKTLSKLERKYPLKVFIVFTDCVMEDCLATLVEIADELSNPPFGQLIAFSVLPLESLHSGSLDGTVMLYGTDRRLADYSFPHLLIHFL
ncbi:hypothetical protein H5410_057092 [Solanum commersonii]|uniref:Uncharacterized protein n=1 Tax=Solanum commersonii TaxID=4109 RepID=A0A9J5WPX2_SOLCO|nr:hypothetical protein H5410_057092 [Solanum commersonii]